MPFEACYSCNLEILVVLNPDFFLISGNIGAFVEPQVLSLQSNYTNALQTSGPNLAVTFAALLLQTHENRPLKLRRLFILLLKSH